MMIETGDPIVYDSFGLRIEALKEERKNVQTIPYTEIERVGCVLKRLSRNKSSPYKAGEIAWSAKQMVEGIEPTAKDAEYLLGIVKPSTFFYALEIDTQTVGYRHCRHYRQKTIPEEVKMTKDCKECFYNQYFGFWLRRNRNITKVSDVVGHAIDLQEACKLDRRKLSDIVAEGSEELPDATMQFAETLLLAESVKAIANMEITNISIESQRRLKNGGRIGFGKTRAGDPETIATRNVFSKRVKGRRVDVSSIPNAAETFAEC